MRPHSLADTNWSCLITFTRPKLAQENGPLLLQLGLNVVELTAEEVEFAQMTMLSAPALSPADCVALSYARRPQHVLVTGDKALRACATGENIPCHGCCGCWIRWKPVAPLRLGPWQKGFRESPHIVAVGCRKRTSIIALRNGQDLLERNDPPLPPPRPQHPPPATIAPPPAPLTAMRKCSARRTCGPCGATQLHPAGCAGGNRLAHARYRRRICEVIS